MIKYTKEHRGVFASSELSDLKTGTGCFNKRGKERSAAGKVGFEGDCELFVTRAVTEQGNIFSHERRFKSRRSARRIDRAFSVEDVRIHPAQNGYEYYGGIRTGRISGVNGTNP